MLLCAHDETVDIGAFNALATATTPPSSLRNCLMVMPLGKRLRIPMQTNYYETLLTGYEYRIEGASNEAAHCPSMMERVYGAYKVFISCWRRFR